MSWLVRIKRHFCRHEWEVDTRITPRRMLHFPDYLVVPYICKKCNDSMIRIEEIPKKDVG